MPTRRNQELPLTTQLPSEEIFVEVCLIAFFDLFAIPKQILLFEICRTFFGGKIDQNVKRRY